MKPQAYAAVVFDMDGILIDSEPLFRRAAQEAARDLGHHLSDETYAMWMGLPPRAVEAAVAVSMGPSFPLQAFRDEFRRIWITHTEQHGVPAQPGMPELLAGLRRVHQAVKNKNDCFLILVFQPPPKPAFVPDCPACGIRLV